MAEPSKKECETRTEQFVRALVEIFGWNIALPCKTYRTVSKKLVSVWLKKFGFKELRPAYQLTQWRKTPTDVSAIV